MKPNYVLYILMVMGLCTLQGQSTFYKKIILSEKAQSGHGLVAQNDTVYLIAYNIPINGSNTNTYIAQVDSNGEILNDRYIDYLDPSDRSIIMDEDHIILAGNRSTTPNTQAIVKLDKELNIVFDKELPTNYKQSFQLGLVRYNDSYIVSVASLDNNETDLFSNFTNLEGDLDSVVLLPLDKEKTFREVLVNRKNELVFFYNLLGEEVTDDLNGILTYKDGVFEELWTTGDYFGIERVIPKATQLKSGEYVMTDINSLFIYAITKLSEDGDLIWNYKWQKIPTRRRVVSKLIECSNGDIIGVGSYSERSEDPRIDDAPFMFKMSTDGDLLWEKAYVDIVDGENKERGLLLDVVELSDGSLMMVGETRSEDTFLDILLIKTDADGCIDDECGINVIVTDIDDIGEKNLKLEAFPNPASDMLHFNQSITQYQITDMMGQKLLSTEGVHQANIDIGYLPKGTYIIQATTKDGIIWRDVIVKI